MGKNKVIVIGIDGGNFNVILPMVERGELPNIASIMRGGVWGNLFSTIPSVTLPAWASFLSGVNPGKLGIFYLTRDSHATYDEGPPADVAKVPTKLLWHHLSDNNKKVLCVIPFPFPPTTVNGIMITHVGSNEIKSYPPGIASDLLNVFSIKEIGEGWNDLKQKYGRTTKEAYLNNVIKMANETAEITRKASLYLLSKYEWDFFVTVFKSTDDTQHRFLSFIDPSHPLYTNKGGVAYGDVVFDTYRRIDKAIGDMLSQAEDAMVIVLSDHGMSPIHKFFYANKWLNEKGLLKVKGSRRKAAFRITGIPLKGFLEKVGIKVNHLPNLNIPVVRRRALPIPEEVDWKQTKAYATIFGVNINLKGREPQGIVTTGEYNELCEILREEMYHLQDPETGEKIVEKVYRREEIYSGPYVDDAPDIVYLFKQPSYHTKKDLYSSALFRRISRKEIVTANHLNHTSTGIFLARGPDIKSKGRFDGVHITDIAPMILYLMGLPIPKNMDGRLLWEVLRQGMDTERPPIYVDSEDFQESVEGLSPEEGEMVKEQLRQLGYI